MDIYDELRAIRQGMEEVKKETIEVKGLLTKLNLDPDERLCPKEVRQILKCSQRKEITLRMTGKLPFVKLGRDVRVKKSDVIKLLNDGF